MFRLSDAGIVPRGNELVAIPWAPMRSAAPARAGNFTVGLHRAQGRGVRPAR